MECSSADSRRDITLTNVMLAAFALISMSLTTVMITRRMITVIHFLAHLSAKAILERVHRVETAAGAPLRALVTQTL